MAKSKNRREREDRKLAEALKKQAGKKYSKRRHMAFPLRLDLADPITCLESLRRAGKLLIGIAGDAFAADGDLSPLKKDTSHGSVIPGHIRPTYASELLQVAPVYSFGNMFNATHADYLGDAAVAQLIEEVEPLAEYDFSQEIVVHFVAVDRIYGDNYETHGYLVHLRKARETLEPLFIGYSTNGKEWRGSVEIADSRKAIVTQKWNGFRLASFNLIAWYLLRRSAGTRYINSEPTQHKPSVATVDGVPLVPPPSTRVIYVNREDVIRPQYPTNEAAKGTSKRPHDRLYHKQTYERIWNDRKTGELRRTICHRHVRMTKVNGGAGAEQPPVNIVRLANPILPKTPEQSPAIFNRVSA